WGVAPPAGVGDVLRGAPGPFAARRGAAPLATTPGAPLDGLDAWRMPSERGAVMRPGAAPDAFGGSSGPTPGSARLAMDQAPPRAPRAEGDALGGLILFFVVIGLVAGGISVLMMSLASGNLLGIAGGAIFSVAALSMGGSALLKRALGRKRR
ncbi:MAG: hypothetical protein AAF281_05655, partial [Pseudomonadota bacterium]